MYPTARQARNSRVDSKLDRIGKKVYVEDWGHMTGQSGSPCTSVGKRVEWTSGPKNGSVCVVMFGNDKIRHLRRPTDMTRTIERTQPMSVYLDLAEAVAGHDHEAAEHLRESIRHGRPSYG